MGICSQLYFFFLLFRRRLTLGYDDINRRTYQCESILSTNHTCRDQEFI